jgi:4-alpha-glucanotransferase
MESKRGSEVMSSGPQQVLRKNTVGVNIPVLGERSSGVLLHPTSLPGPHGSGDLGHEARKFIEFLASAGQRWWQMLPVGPPGYGNSPYSVQSAFAGSPLLISLEALAAEGLLAKSDLEGAGASDGGQGSASMGPFPADHVDYGPVIAMREAMLTQAHAAFTRRGAPSEVARFQAFCAENERWLEDYALFSALKSAFGGAPWPAWEPSLRDREPRALAEARRRYRDAIAFHRFTQYLFDQQWQALRAVAAERGVGLVGDLPIFVAHDSADVWQRRDLFYLDERGQPEVVAGVPPDYFSSTGQRWGNPLYRWKRMAKTGFAWWVDRLRVTLQRFDAVRLDHFIGFQRYWEIPATCPTAVEGRWVKGPGAPFFKVVQKKLGALPLIAEDLGAVTPKVTALRDRFKLPGIRVLQFAFGNDQSAIDFLPYNYPRRAVVYTGTHDNDTTVGWFRDPGGSASIRTKEQIERERQAALEYLGTDGREVHWDMIRTALGSVAATVILPAQDLLGLGSEARMNRPGLGEGNWEWRLPSGALDEAIAGRLLRLTQTYGRSSSAPRES